jgi:hypothetical protein
VIVVPIPQHVIDQIRDRSDVVEVVGQYVDLKRAGTNYKGLCPFHQERTPSFVVSPDRQKGRQRLSVPDRNGRGQLSRSGPRTG